VCFFEENDLRDEEKIDLGGFESEVYTVLLKKFVVDNRVDLR